MIDVKVNWKNIKKDRYRVKELLSYKRSISLVVGERRVGKTFEILLCLILDALKKTADGALNIIYNNGGAESLQSVARLTISISDKVKTV